MGYIHQSNEIITNVSKELNNILDSPMTQFLQLGTPVLMEYYNCNSMNSTTLNGLDTIDDILGKNSPIRFNKVINLPVYGPLRNFLINLTENDGLFDMGMELDDLTLLPGTIVPTPYDHMVYRFSDNGTKRVVVFRVTEIKKTSIKSHYFEQFAAKLHDIDSYGEIEYLEKQTSKTFIAKLDNIGTNEKCILEEEQYQYSTRIDKIINKLIEEYVDMFYSKKYSSLIFRGELEQGYISYDPWLTHFCITNKIFTKRPDDGEYTVLANLDRDDDYKKKYNCTFYHALETRSMGRYKQMLFVPTNFSKSIADPFKHYGDEVAFKIDIYEEDEIKYPRNIYLDFPFIQSIAKKNGENDLYATEANLIIRFFEKETLLNNITENELYSLENHINMDHDAYTFRVIPMIIYVLSTLNDDIMKAYA